MEPAAASPRSTISPLNAIQTHLLAQTVNLSFTRLVIYNTQL